ncbi:MAG: TetR/AcrR family transcriptional regulator [Alphaproteobacteria bacterium]
MSPEQRAASILDAAKAEFVERGFEAARIDDIARRAGIAKGTVYLHFPSKEALFLALVRVAVVPAVHAMRTLVDTAEGSSADLLRGMLALIKRELLGTERRLLVRLILTEGHRFPDLAATYHDEVVSHGMALIRAVIERGVARGEFRADAVARFPQLFAAPVVLAVLWEGLFGARAPLDTDGLLDAHLETLLHGLAGDRP